MRATGDAPAFLRDGPASGFFRFLWAIGVSWNEATRVEERDFSLWIQLVDKPLPRGAGAPAPAGLRSKHDAKGRGAPNALM